MSTVARAATVSAPKQLAITEGPIPIAEPGQVVVQVRYCGVCGTDVHGFEAPEMLPPAVFGHEWTGAVVATGDGVDTVAAGDRVAVAVGPACGTCSMCRAGHPEHCDTAFSEANGVTPDAPPHGGFATHIAVAERRVVALLDGITDEQAAIVEPTAVTFHAVRRTMVPLGAIVVVQGAGPIGLLTAQLARHAGAGRVLISEPVPARRDAARGLGFSDVFEPGADLTEALTALTSSRGADVLFECTGVAGLLQPSAELFAVAAPSRSSATPPSCRRCRTGTGWPASSASWPRSPTSTRTSSARCSRSRRGPSLSALWSPASSGSTSWPTS